MKKKLFCFMLAVLAVSFPVAAQQQAKIPKVGRLSSASLALGGQREFLGRELRPLGYVDGKNIAIEFRYADNKLDRLPALAEELVGLKVDVLVAGTTPGALAAKNATRTIPIVFHSVSDPIAVGLIDSLARPGGNITGITDISAVLAGKRLELLKETVAKLSRVAVMWEPKNAGSAQTWKESQLPARELGLQLHSMEVSSADQFEGAFKNAIKARSTALAVTPMVLASTHRKQVVELAAKSRLPAMYYREVFVESGGLMSYGADLDDHFMRAAAIIDKILKGTKPADIPVEQPMKFEFIINLKAAKQIGLTIPPNVLVRAGKVIR